MPKMHFRRGASRPGPFIWVPVPVGRGPVCSYMPSTYSSHSPLKRYTHYRHEFPSQSLARVFNLESKSREMLLLNCATYGPTHILCICSISRVPRRSSQSSQRGSWMRRCLLRALAPIPPSISRFIPPPLVPSRSCGRCTPSTEAAAYPSRRMRLLRGRPRRRRTGGLLRLQPLRLRQPQPRVALRRGQRPRACLPITLQLNSTRAARKSPSFGPSWCVALLF